ncbi:MAG: hypothetical protein IJP10_04530 [Clostridia bacterium]|nr:hypothetical protein [Clostridia bacterium]
MKKKIITIVSLIMMISMLTAIFGCSAENSGVICEITSITWDDEYFEQIPESDLTDYLPENVYGDELCDIATWQYFLDNKSSYSAYKINFVVTNNTSGMATDIVINFKEDYGRSVIMYSDFDSVPFFEKGTCDWEEHILILVEDKALSESEKIELLESIELTATYEVVLKTPLEFLMCDASATGEGKGGDVEFVKSEDFEVTVCTSDSDEEVSDTYKPEFYKIAKFEKENNWLNSIGIISPFVAQEKTLKTDNGTYPLYHIHDQAAFKDQIYHSYSYIAVEKDSEILLFAVDGSYANTVYTCDIDGDKCDEIVFQQTIGMASMSGTYLSTIFKMSGDEFEIIFSSYPIDAFDTGFESAAQDGFKLLISNRFTEYEKVISFADRKNDYIGVYYDETGKPLGDCNVMIDDFYEFYPEDVDGDDVFELVGLQNVSLYGHSDYIGDAYSVLKFSNDTNQFEVVSCKFLTPKYE